MRRLFIAAVVLLAGPAQAVDYVKCEAMQKALSRVTASAEQVEKDVWGEIYDRYTLNNCGLRPSAGLPGYSTKSVLAWYDCSSTTYRANYEKMKKELAADPRVLALRTRAAKIQADYSKQGCY